MAEIVAEGPAEPQRVRRRREVRQLPTGRDAHQVEREVGPGGDRQVERAPQLGIDLHQVVAPVGVVALELDHRHAVPAQRIEDGAPGREQRLVAHDLAARALAAGDRELAHRTVGHDPPAATLLVRGEDAEPGAHDALLKERH